MRLDENDLRIIGLMALLKKNESITSYHVAKNLYNLDSRYEATRKDAFIRARLSKLISDGLILREDIDGKAYYKPNRDSLRIVKGALRVRGVKLATGEFLLVKNGSGINVFQIFRGN